MEERTRKTGKAVASSAEIVRAERDSAADDTRVKTAVSWLEEATLLSREENRVQVFPSSLRSRTLAEAEVILTKVEVTGTRRKQLLDIVRHLMKSLGTWAYQLTS